MTDCFQPIEKIHGVTYECLKEFKKYNKPYLIVTKSDLVADDKYIEVLDKDLAHIQVTITSTDDDTAAKYESATRSSDRIKAIEKLQRL
jgi:DNA repair photolyase